MNTTGVPADTDPIELRVLGGVDLRAGRREVSRVLSQPRRLALLIYLALGPRDTFQRRDHLLGVFWPESPESKARASLRQAIRFLRRWLGPDVFPGRGDELGVDRGLLSCDARLFDDAVEHGRDQEALTRYGGDLLPGFFVSGAPAFDRWLETERRRLRAAALEVALRTSRTREENGDLDGASEAARKALLIEPLDEEVGRRHIRLLDRTGNRAGAVAAYRALSERMREELDLEPAPETVALIESIRSRTSAAGSVPTRGVLDPGRVLVRPFENMTRKDSLAVIGSMAADSISRQLLEVRELEVVSERGGPREPEVVDPPTGSGENIGNRTESAGASGAGTVVEGRYYLENTMLRFEPRIIDVAAGRLLPGPAGVVVPEDEALKGLEELSRSLLTFLAPALSHRVRHVREGSRPPSFEAYREYMEGLELFIEGDWNGALVHFRKSAEVAPDYALPRIVCVIALWNLGKLREAKEVASEAEQLRGTVGRFERAVLDMALGWLQGDWAAACRAARLQAELAPGSIPHFQVAEDARRLNRPGEARDILVRLDPERGELRGWIFYWIELCKSYHLLGEHEAERDAAVRARELHPSASMPILLEIRALAALGDSGEVGRRVDEALSLPGPGDLRPGVLLPGALLQETALELQAHGNADSGQGILARAISWYSERVSDSSSPALRRDFARALYHAGRLDSAEKVFRGLVAESPTGMQRVGGHHGYLRGHRDEAYLAAISVQRGDEPEAGRWCRRLENLQGPFLYGSDQLSLAAVAALRGNAEKSVSTLRRAFAGGLPFDIFLHTDPRFFGVRGEAGFEALLRPRG